MRALSLTFAQEWGMNWWQILVITVLTATIASAHATFKPLELLWTQQFYGHADVITASALSYDKTQLVSSDADGQVIVWDALTGKIIHSWSDPSRVTALAFGFGDASIVASSDDRSIRIWNATSGELQTSWKLTTSYAMGFKPKYPTEV
jgi:WD40 repeat protein